MGLSIIEIEVERATTLRLPAFITRFREACPSLQSYLGFM